MHLLPTVSLEDIGKSVFKDVPDAIDNTKEDDLYVGPVVKFNIE